MSDGQTQACEANGPFRRTSVGRCEHCNGVGQIVVMRTVYECTHCSGTGVAAKQGDDDVDS